MCIRGTAGDRGPSVNSGDEKKRAENEATFREANEQIRAAERELTAPEYEHVREDGATFAIALGRPSEGEEA